MHTGKGRTSRRSLHRTHGPHVQDRPRHATLPAGKSAAGGQSTGLSVPPPLREARRDVLTQCWRDLRQDAAAGVDQGSAQEDAPHPDENIHRLVERVQQQRYRAHASDDTLGPQGMARSVLWASPQEKTHACTWQWRASSKPSTSRTSCAVARGIGRMVARWRRWRHGPSRGHADETPGEWKQTSRSALTPSIRSRNSATPCSAAPRGARSTATYGCQGSSSGCTPHAVGTPMTTECTGTPPACTSAATVPCGLCCSGSTDVANATVTRSKAPKTSWSAAKSHDHGSLDDPRRGRQPSRQKPIYGSAYG